MRIYAAAALLLLVVVPAPVFGQAPVAYRLTFPEPEHRWMQIEIVFPDLPAEPLELHMSRASPGRYVVHEFAKNVFDLDVTDPAGAPLVVTHTTPDQWLVATHPSTMRVSYRVFGDR